MNSNLQRLIAAMLLLYQFFIMSLSGFWMEYVAKLESPIHKMGWLDYLQYTLLATPYLCLAAALGLLILRRRHVLLALLLAAICQGLVCAYCMYTFLAPSSVIPSYQDRLVDLPFVFGFKLAYQATQIVGFHLLLLTCAAGMLARSSWAQVLTVAALLIELIDGARIHLHYGIATFLEPGGYTLAIKYAYVLLILYLLLKPQGTTDTAAAPQTAKQQG